MTQTRIVLPDVHIPFQDKPLLNVWLRHAANLQPDGVDILGDVIDAFQLSRFDKNPARKHTIQDEADMAHAFLSQVRDAVGPTCDLRYSEGNHENRLTRTLWGKARELEPIRNLRIPQLLGLDKLGVVYHPSSLPYQLGGLTVIHGDVARKSNWSNAYGGSAAQAVCKVKHVNILMGHTHQMGHVCYRSWEKQIEGWECGCLCRFDMDYLVGTPQWQQGWAVIKLLPRNLFDISFVRVLDCGKKRVIVHNGEILDEICGGFHHGKRRLLPPCGQGEVRCQLRPNLRAKKVERSKRRGQGRTRRPKIKGPGRHGAPK